MQLSPTRPLGLAHFSCIEATPAELVRLAGWIGYASVGLRLHPAFPGAPFYEVPLGSEASREMLSLLAGEGVAVYDIEFVTIGEDFDAATLTRMLADAGRLGAKRLSVCGDDPDRGRLIANFADLCDRAAAVDMGVDLEVMPWRRVGTLQEATAVVAAAGRGNGGVLVDALHLSRSGGDPDDVRRLPPAMVRSAQLCDAPATRPADTQVLIAEARGGRLPPGEGALPLGRLLAALPDHAVLSVEVPNAGRLPEEHARRVFDAARRTISTFALGPST